MILLTLLITILLEYYFNIGAYFRRMQWFHQYCEFIETQLARYFPQSFAIAEIFAMLLPIVLLVGLLQSLLNTPLWGSLDLLFGVAVLLATVQAKPLITAYMKTSDKNQAKDLSDALSDNPDHLNFAQFLRHEKQNLLCPIFWYVLLGPMGAVLYRLSLECERGEQHEKRTCALGVWLAWLEWLPVRLSVLSFAVVDNFAPCFQYWLASLTYPASANDDVLIDGAARASGIKAQALVTDKPDSIGLLAHSLIFWLVLVAILTVTAWVN